MKFGSVAAPDQVDFTLPPDHGDTVLTLQKIVNKKDLKFYVGTPKWSKDSLKGFYPQGTRDELTYYSQHFDAIELNATFYKLFAPEVFQAWYDKAPTSFKFFPKVYQSISHYKRLNNIDVILDDFIYNISLLKEKLGTVFLQMPSHFSPKYFDRVEAFISKWPIEIPLAIEFRHEDWNNGSQVSDRLYHLLENYNITNIIVDTAGRRDLLHMRLTTSKAFVRFVGVNTLIDYERLDSWIERLALWHQNGIKEIDFFIHQNIEQETPLLISYFIKQANKRFNINLKVPEKNLTLN